MDAFLDLIEDALCNGWQMVDPEITGDLTTNPFCISDNICFNDKGLLTDIDTCYYYNQYQTTNIIQDLEEHGHVTFQKHYYKE